MILRLLSWNVNRRTTRLAEQVDAMMARFPDIVALQEVTPNTRVRLADALSKAGLPHSLDSFALAPVDFVPSGPRRHGQLFASRYPLKPISPGRFDVPWPERVLSAVVEVPKGPIEVHTTHIPAGSSHGWTKIETLEGLAAGLKCSAKRSRILCGDFNTPQWESTTGEVVTWSQRIRKNGTVATLSKRWANGERGVLTGLADFDLSDVFRTLHGYNREGFSWLPRPLNKPSIKRRFDHIFASASLRPVSCDYIHEVRESGLSDHSIIEAVFNPMPAINPTPRAMPRKVGKRSG